MIRQLLQVDKPKLEQQWLEHLLSVLKHEHEAIAKAINYELPTTISAGSGVVPAGTGFMRVSGGVLEDPVTISLDLDGTLAANSDANVASQKAVKTYVNARSIRKVGISIDGGGAAITTGVKGIIQVDFAGTIIGWSVVADQPGTLSVEVDKKAGTQTLPVVPNTTTDKISAAAPIALAGPAQAAGAGTTGVSTWTTAVAQWDSVQFNVVSATTVQRVTLYLRIQES